MGGVKLRVTKTGWAAWQLDLGGPHLIVWRYLIARVDKGLLKTVEEIQ